MNFNEINVEWNTKVHKIVYQGQLTCSSAAISGVCAASCVEASTSIESYHFRCC